MSRLSMTQRVYMDIQKVLDQELGTEEEDGAGEGIVADILLALDKREKRGAVKALRLHADEMNRRAASPLVGFPGGLLEATGHARILADHIESGDVTL